MAVDDDPELKELRDDMELARLALVDAKTVFDRACDAVYVYVRAKRESK